MAKRLALLLVALAGYSAIVVYADPFFLFVLQRPALVLLGVVALVIFFGAAASKRNLSPPLREFSILLLIAGIVWLSRTSTLWFRRARLPLRKHIPILLPPFWSSIVGNMGCIPAVLMICLSTHESLAFCAAATVIIPGAADTRSRSRSQAV
jgi:hypothetical protein